MEKILIIEDEVSIADVQKDYFEMNGFQVTVESDGYSGLRRAKQENYDLIILDIMLPGIDGFEICKQIREDKDIPVLMVSARKDDFDKIHGLGLGADDYIVKPFSTGELVARVKAHISRYQRISRNIGAKNDDIHVRGLHIDKAARRVFVNGKEQFLTNKEFDLLSLLATNPNRVFSKEELFDRIWEMDSFGELPTVAVHIRKIREKIEIDPSSPQYIETVWGAGYRFKEDL